MLQNGIRATRGVRGTAARWVRGAAGLLDVVLEIDREVACVTHSPISVTLILMPRYRKTTSPCGRHGCTGLHGPNRAE